MMPNWLINQWITAALIVGALLAGADVWPMLGWLVTLVAIGLTVDLVAWDVVSRIARMCRRGQIRS